MGGALASAISVANMYFCTGVQPVPPNSTGRLNVAVHGDDGDDNLELAVFGADALEELLLLMDGGNGFDVGRATANVVVKEVEKFEFIR